MPYYYYVITILYNVIIFTNLKADNFIKQLQWWHLKIKEESLQDGRNEELTHVQYNWSLRQYDQCKGTEKYYLMVFY